MKAQRALYDSGNELAAYAAKQINYHVMGYYPITPSTQIAEELDLMKSEGSHDISLVAAEGEHSAAGICYGASVAGGRVFNATSANGLLYALEQFPVQSGTRFPMVMNVACRTVSGPLSIKGDHSDIMYMLNTGWLILYANNVQAIYDFNIMGLKIAEKVKLPIVIAFDGFFTSHQKRKCVVFENDQDVKDFIGPLQGTVDITDFEHPVSIGSYMNEPDIINNKFQLHQAMEEARTFIDEVFSEYETMSERHYQQWDQYHCEDAEVIMFLLGSSYHTALEAVNKLELEGKKVGIFTTNVLRPFPQDLWTCCKNAHTILIMDRQDSYGAKGGNMSLEIKALLQQNGIMSKVITRIYGLGGRDFYLEEAIALFNEAYQRSEMVDFDYLGKYAGDLNLEVQPYFKPLTEEDTCLDNFTLEMEAGKYVVKTKTLSEMTNMPFRLASGHGACPGCGIPVNVNLLLKGIEGNVILLFQTGCGMVVTTAYPKTSFKIPYIHNLFQNGAATLSGVVEMVHQRQKRHEIPEGKITFVMISGDGGMDIGMGSALGAALRNSNLIIMEYDNGGYMNTGYQLSYSTPKGAKSSTSHVGKYQDGKKYFHKDMPQIMAASNIPYIATVSESNPMDFIKKAQKAQKYANEYGMAYLKALSACPLNWNDAPNTERRVIASAVDCCYFPLYEIEQGITTLNYDPQKANKKIPVLDWLKMMGRTKHLIKPEYLHIVEEIQQEIDSRWLKLKARDASEIL